MTGAFQCLLAALRPAQNIHLVVHTNSHTSHKSNCSFHTLVELLPHQRRIKGGGNRGSAPPWACQGGALPPPEILASKKSKEDLEELCYFIHNILNPNDPLLREKFPRRVYLIIQSRYLKINLNRICKSPLLLFALQAPPPPKGYINKLPIYAICFSLKKGE